MSGIDHLLDTNVVIGLLKGARAFLSACQVVGITAEIEDKAIRLRRSGALKLPDAIVAATALSTGAALLGRAEEVLDWQRDQHRCAPGPMLGVRLRQGIRQRRR